MKPFFNSMQFEWIRQGVTEYLQINKRNLQELTLYILNNFGNQSKTNN